MAITLQHIRQAAETIKGNIEHTPCVHSTILSRMTGAEVVLKFENLQWTGSFKARGALVKLLSLTSSERKRGVIAMSAGNHAQALASYAQQLNIPTVIVMPRYTPNTKIEQTRSFGAEVMVMGEDLQEACEVVQRVATERKLCLVHPYDDELIIAGQGTVALEMLDTYPDLDMLIAPVGGGGLMAGCAVAAQGLKPGIQLVGVQTERYPAMTQLLKGQPIECGTSTIAEGIAVKSPGKLTVPIIRDLVENLMLVNEDKLEQAVLLLLKEEKTVVEGAGAAGLAALMTDRGFFYGKKVGIILSGGNMDFLILSSIIQRGLVRSGRMIRLSVELRDVPGALADVSRCIGQTDANIVEVHHQRAFSHLPLQSAEVEFVLLTRGQEHIQEVLTILNSNGHKPHLLDENGKIGSAGQHP